MFTTVDKMLAVILGGALTFGLSKVGIIPEMSVADAINVVVTVVGAMIAVYFAKNKKA